MLVKRNLYPNIGKDSTVSAFTEKKKSLGSEGYENTRKPLRCQLTPKLNFNVITAMRNSIPERPHRGSQLQNVLVVVGLLAIRSLIPG
jgi:hypothetical protein